MQFEANDPPFPGWALYEIYTAFDFMDKVAINKWIRGQLAKNSSVGTAGERFEFAFKPAPRVGGCFLTIRDLLLNEELSGMGNA